MNFFHSKMSLIGRCLSREGVRRGCRSLSWMGAPKAQLLAVAQTAAPNGEAERWEDAKPFESIPGPKPLPIPIFGNVWRFIGASLKKDFDVTTWQRSLRVEYGDIVRVTGLGRKDMVMLYDPSYIEKMHRNESAWPIREGIECMVYYQDHVRPDIYGQLKGLPTLHGKPWHEVRSAVNPTMMQPRRAKIYTEPIVSIANEFVDRIRKIRDEKLEVPNDFANELNKWSLESIAYVALDTRLGCLADNLDPNSRAQKMITAVLHMFECFYYLDVMPSVWKYVSTPRWRSFVKTMDTVVDFAYTSVNEKVKLLQDVKDDGSTQPKSVLETLLRTQNKNFAIVTAMDMLVAGIDTTANGVANTLALLAANPEKQEKLLNELKRFMPTKDSPLTSEMLTEMKYLKATIKEAFRMKPVAPGNSRTSVKDMVIGDYQIPKGTRLVSLHHIICSDEKHFKLADQFIPERWLKSASDSELSVSNVHPFTYLPFGFGPRMCVGRRFAELEMEVAVSRIIRNFRVSYHYGPMEWSTILFIKPSKPLKFRMEDRME